MIETLAWVFTKKFPNWNGNGSRKGNPEPFFDA
jgi:hypothetical protein